MTTFKINSLHPKSGYVIKFKDGREFVFKTIEECIKIVGK